MKKTADGKSKIFHRESIPYIVAGILFLLYFLRSETIQDDVAVIQKYGYVNSLWQHILLMKEDYLNWSSRILVNFPIHVLITHKLVWILCNTAIVLLFMCGVEKLIFSEKDAGYRWYIVGIVLLFPWKYLGQSGWIVTSMTYLWPATALLYWLLLLKQYIQGEKPCYWKIAISVLLGLYATNLEQMAVLGTVIVCGLCIYAFMQKKKKPLILVWILVLVAAFMIHLMVPGESARYAQEIGKQFPDYLMLNTINKLDLGISTALTEFMKQINFPFLLFAYLLLKAVKQNGKESLYQAVAAVPFGLGILWPLSASVLAGTKYDISSLKATRIGAVTADNFLTFNGFYMLLVVTACAICIGLSLLVAFDNLQKGIVMASMFVGAYATRVMMAFSPTIWASGERTYLAMYFVFAILSLFLLEERLHNTTEKEHGAFNSVLTIGAVYSLICWLI
ncbi:MAG: DUF6056 family protein [Agathobacter sp.]|nr:DUF6056 family protein [Agathobacter sp.]